MIFRYCTLLATWMGIVALGGCAAVPPTSSITGSASYRERMALPPDAVLEVQLEDVSRADAPAVEIGGTTVQPVGQVPIRFEIPYDPARLQSGHRYQVRASIKAGGSLLFVTDTAYPVLGADGVRHVDMLLKRAMPAEPSSRATLENTYWKMVRLNGQPVTVAEHQREPHLVLHPDRHSVSGSGGCNGMGGSYRLEGQRLTFSRMAGTLMACPHGMDQEHRIHTMLPTVASWQIEGERLRLLDGQGTVVAEFESRYMQ